MQERRQTGLRCAGKTPDRSSPGEDVQGTEWQCWGMGNYVKEKDGGYCVNKAY